jgi:hypothetical protein
VTRRDRNARALDWNSPLELLERDPDTRVIEPRERFFEPEFAHERSDVAELEAGRVEERTVWAALVPVDRPIEDRQKRLLACAELLLDDAPRFLARKSCPEEARQSARVPDEGDEIVGE